MSLASLALATYSRPRPKPKRLPRKAENVLRGLRLYVEEKRKQPWWIGK
jgi:hypothetical protein